MGAKYSSDGERPIGRTGETVPERRADLTESFERDLDVIEIAGALKPLPDGRVCAVTKKGGPCLITFTKEDGAWRLTSYDGDTSMLKLKL